MFNISIENFESQLSRLRLTQDFNQHIESLDGRSFNDLVLRLRITIEELKDDPDLPVITSSQLRKFEEFLSNFNCQTCN